MPDYDGGKIKVKLVIDASEAFQTLDSVAAKAGQGIRMNAGAGGAAPIPTGARQSAHANAAMSVPVDGGAGAAIAAGRILASSPVNATISAHANAAQTAASAQFSSPWTAFTLGNRPVNNPWPPGPNAAWQQALNPGAMNWGSFTFGNRPVGNPWASVASMVPPPPPAWSPWTAGLPAYSSPHPAMAAWSSAGPGAAVAPPLTMWQRAGYSQAMQNRMASPTFPTGFSLMDPITRNGGFDALEAALGGRNANQGQTYRMMAPPRVPVRNPGFFAGMRGAMGAEIMGSGPYMSFLFGGMEVTRAYNTLNRAYEQAGRLYSTPEKELAAFQGAIQGIEGGMMGGLPTAMARAMPDSWLDGLDRMGLAGRGLAAGIRSFTGPVKAYDRAVAGAENSTEAANRRQMIMDQYGFGPYGRGARSAMALRQEGASVGLTSFAAERAAVEVEEEGRLFDIGSRRDAAKAIANQPGMGAYAKAAVSALDEQAGMVRNNAARAKAAIYGRQVSAIRSNYDRAGVAEMRGSGRLYDAELAAMRSSKQDDLDASPVGMRRSVAARWDAEIDSFERTAWRLSAAAQIERGGELRAQANDMSGGRSMASLRIRLQGAVGAAMLRMDPSAPGYREAVADLKRASGNELAFAGRKYETTLAEMEASSQGLMFAAEGRPMMGSIVETLQRGRAAFDAATDPRMREAIRRNTQFQLSALKRAAEEGMQRSSAVAIAVQRTDLSGAAGRFGENLAAAADAANKGRDLAGGWNWRPIEGGPIEPGEDFAAAAKAIGGGAGEFGDAVKMFMEAVRQFKVRAS